MPQHAETHKQYLDDLKEAVEIVKKDKKVDFFFCFFHQTLGFSNVFKINKNKNKIKSSPKKELLQCMAN